MEETILEQPPVDNLNSQDDFNMGQSENENIGGSNAKFKSVEALNNAYNSLQAEFTKKCQRLSELEKEKQNSSIPRYKLDDWPTQLCNFFENNPNAKEYSKDIAKQLIEDEELAKKSDCLTLAWAKIMSKQKINKSDLVKDSEFLENYIFNNEKIKDQIIKDYIAKLEKAPRVMSENKGSNFNLTSVTKPKTIDEAKNVIQQFFK